MKPDRYRTDGILFDPRELVRFGPHLGAHKVALRVVFSISGPLILLLTVGHLELAGYALLAALASVYGRMAPTRQRLAVQAEFGTCQVALIILGAALSAADAPGWLILLLIASAAGLGTVIADARSWRPAGSVFFVFGLGVSASLPATWPGVGVAALLASSALVFTLLVTLISGAGKQRLRARRRLAGEPTGSYPALRPASRNWRLISTHALMCFVGAFVAGAISLALGWQHPYWAMVSAVVPVVGASTSGQLIRGSHRVLGTLIGLIVAILLFGWQPQGLLLVLILVALQAGTELVVLRNYAAALLFLTPLTVGMGLLNGPVPVLPLVIDRGLETVVGVAVAAVLILATHRVRHPKPIVG
ncbi:FUSC family protein [Mycetocola zhadangensis]|uniref:FUSC family protein n=2 Tax=Mycetocola zhadangensis TaxID=1164595 RepID=A0A3L7J1N1_9MICO|nr:FUSC family protein [Mycetocola zhadangensis]RLQ84407.1 FUSC family protein [Mycetocola zhadangensis]GGE93247.1 FUSC family protein [Mycetocola zhadangensis]